jgi:hypothetical protein
LLYNVKYFNYTYESGLKPSTSKYIPLDFTKHTISHIKNYVHDS